jgi:hypothetical protein
MIIGITLYDYCHPWLCSSYVPINDLDGLTKQLKRERIFKIIVFYIKQTKLNYLQKEKEKSTQEIQRSNRHTTLLVLRMSYICIRTFQEYIVFIFSPIILTRLHIKWE